MTYGSTGRIARITLNRPERGNGITLDCRASSRRASSAPNLDPRRARDRARRATARASAAATICVASAEQAHRREREPARASAPGSPLDPRGHGARTTIRAQTWDPMVDYQMMSRNVRGFMSLFHADKPVVCKVHGFCVAGGTDMALCCDLLVIADDAKIGYPPARVWGVADDRAVGASHRAREGQAPAVHRRLSVAAREAVEWGLAIECAPRRPARRALRDPARAHRARCRSTSS